MSKQPILINFESSCDACGKETISKRVKEILEAHGKKVLLTDFPRYGEYSGSLIERHLKHDIINIKNSDLGDGAINGIITFKDGRKKSTDDYLTKEEIENIASVDFDKESIESIRDKINKDIYPFILSSYHSVADNEIIITSKYGKVLFAFLYSPKEGYNSTIDKLISTQVDRLTEVADRYYETASALCLFKPGSNPSHLTRSLLYAIDRDIWFANRPTLFTSESEYDVILSDRSYMSNVIYRTVNMSDYEFMNYLIMTYWSEIVASGINNLSAKNVKNIILTHDDFSFNKEIIIKRAEEKGEKLDATERDFSYQEKVFGYAKQINARVHGGQIISKSIYNKIAKSPNHDDELKFVENEYIFEYFKSDMMKVSDGNVWRSTDYVAEMIARKYVLGE